MTVAINAEGKALRWDGRAWVPTKTARNPETGETAVLDGDKWVVQKQAPAAEPAQREVPPIPEPFTRGIERAVPAPPLAGMGPGGSDVQATDQPAFFADREAARAPAPTLADSAKRGLTIGTQAVGQGLADMAGLPVDLASAAMDVGSAGAERVARLAGFDPHLPRFSGNAVGGSESISNAASQVAEAAGIPLVNEADMTPVERLAYQTERFGSGAIAGSGGLARAAARRATELASRPATPRLADGLLRPFMDNPSSALVNDAVAGAGAGAGLEANRQHGPEATQGSVSDLVAMLLGGGTAGLAKSAVTAPRTLARNLLSRLPDSEIPLDPASHTPTSRRTANKAADVIQSQTAGNPAEAAAAIKRGTDFYRGEGLPQQTTGRLSNDEGLLALERDARRNDPVPFVKRDRELRQAQSKDVQSLMPDGVQDAEAAGRVATDFARQTVDQRTTAARQNVKAAEQRVTQATAEEQAIGGQLAELPAVRDSASKSLDKTVVQDTMLPRRAEKNARFAAIDPEGQVQRDVTPLRKAVEDMRASVGELNDPNTILPQRLIDRITEAGDTVSFRDINRLRPELSDAMVAAREGHNLTLADNLRRVKREIDNEIDRLAASDGPEGIRAKDARDYYRQEYAPYFSQGEGGNLRRQIGRDDPARTNTPPTTTAQRFLFAGSGGEEAARDLRRILEIAPTKNEGLKAARSYVIADLAKTVGQNGKVNPHQLRAWIDHRQGIFEAFPEIKAEVTALLRNVVNKSATTDRLQRELDSFVGDLKLTEREIRNNGISLLLDASPAKAVERVFAAPDKARAMQEIVDTLKGNKNALKGWKSAVADDLERRLTGTQTQQTAEDAFPVMQSKLENLLRNPDVNKALSVLYKDDPGAMNALKRAQQIGRDMARSNIPGSSSREGSVGRSRVWRLYEVVIKSRFGGLRGGNIVRNTRVALGLLPNVSQTVKIERLIMRMQFEPELAQHLLTKTVKHEDPVWRTKMLRLLAVGEAVRPNTPGGQAGTGGDDQGKPELPPLTKTMVGKTAEGRRIMRNEDGSVSTERTATVQVDGKFVNIPTIYEGKQVTEKEALRIIERNHFVDPETKRKILFYGTVDEAVAAAEKRSARLSAELAKMGATARRK